MENNYPKAYKEVIEVLKYVPEKSVNKIPEIMIKTFNEKMDKDYNFEVDTNRSFGEQELLEETKAILANIYVDYWATPEQKEEIKRKDRLEFQKIEEAKRAKYDVDVFKEKRNSMTQDYSNKSQTENNNLPSKEVKEKFFQKMVNFFKKIFKLN